MKYILLVLLLSSCGNLRFRGYNPTPETPVVITITDKLQKCVMRLIERNGVKADSASTVCSKIYRRD